LRNGYLSIGLVAAVLTLSPGLVAQKVKQTIIPVTSTLADTGDTGYPYRVQSDRKGPYVTKTVNRTNQVDSVLIHREVGTDWLLTTYYVLRGGLAASDRTVFFDVAEQVLAGGFPTPVLGSEGGVPVERGYVTSQLTAKCREAGVNMLAMTAGSTVLCPGSMRFQAPDGEWYRFSFQPDNFAATERFNVTCTRADTTGCREWRITPSGSALTGNDPNHKNRNTLLLIDESGNILAQGGDYYLSFAVTVTR
jgi:hypothetical protein